MAAFTAAGTSYATHGEPMIPVYVFYSMFGFQRTGDAIWAAMDQMARGFIIGATAGRTTLTGEGLQHADGHSPVLAATNPAIKVYDPAYGYEIAHIVKAGLEQMYGPDSTDPNVMYYLTVYNEPMLQPAEPEDVDVEGIVRGLHRLRTGARGRPAVPAARLRRVRAVGPRGGSTARARTGGSPPTCGRSPRGPSCAATAWPPRSTTSCTPTTEPRTPYVTEKLADAAGPVIATTDYVSEVPDQIRQFLPGPLRHPGRRRARLLRHPGGGAAVLPHRRPLRWWSGPCSCWPTRARSTGRLAREAAERYRLLDVTAGTTGNAGGDS